ncbi:GtrA family protein [Rhodoblastus acidophilus]|uniref:GtrA family protein n=1 Tax=Rhodoblastus acidophilus TaxID=1074 RepID=UPI0022251664|nr:GtrA family protein [Rhodoblastus acidophilus]
MLAGSSRVHVGGDDGRRATGAAMMGLMSRALLAAKRCLDVRFLRFLVVGGFNTLFGFGLFYTVLRLSGAPMFALTFSTILAILFNFMTTGGLVFRNTERRRLLPFFGVYVIVYLYNAAGLTIFQAAGVDAGLAGLLLLPGAVLISYALNRSFVFASKPIERTRAT